MTTASLSCSFGSGIMQFIIKSNYLGREFIFSDFEDVYVMFEIKSHNCKAKERIHISPYENSLCEYLQDLGMQDLPWSGVMKWDSYEHELSFRAKCSALSIVELQARLRNSPEGYDPFEVNASIFLDLGSLPDIANETRRFFPGSRDIRMR